MNRPSLQLAPTDPTACSALGNPASGTRSWCGDPRDEDAGTVSVLDIRADARGTAPDPGSYTPAQQQMLHLTVVENGAAVIIQGGHETVLRTGDVTVHPAHLAHSVLLTGNTRLSVLAFPREMLLTGDELLGSVTGRVLDERPELTGVVGAFIAHLAQHGGDLDPLHARRPGAVAVDLAATLIGSGSTADRSTTRSTMMGRIAAFVEDHLADPDLDPPRIARAHHMSVRALHALFAQHGSTVASRIRTRRLARCYDALIDARLASVPIATIASTHGFTTPAHFTRAFRARYGRTPSEVARRTRSQDQRRTPPDVSSVG
ncbi:helix-turn-helix domain-containing protein [Arthrobacter sp. RIT-PI-e]|uniref:helix-turn-helix domain-containing protein n=1 Tax=Arthrobacter sp. RIT-PI-e TaxID=1681197 RepID=UPI0006769E60|nr:helix-turn-helix domain-containing protein [Arthrobacter sp. RIT-PI-e]